MDNGSLVPEEAHNTDGGAHIDDPVFFGNRNSRIFIGIILGNITHTCNTGIECQFDIFCRVQGTYHMIPEMRLDRYYLTNSGPFFRRFKNQAATFHDFVAVLFRHAHDPVQRYAESIQNDITLFEFFIDISEPFGGFFPGVPADVCMVHDFAFFSHFHFVFGFRANAIFFHEQSRSYRQSLCFLT